MKREKLAFMQSIHNKTKIIENQKEKYTEISVRPI